MQDHALLSPLEIARLWAILFFLPRSLALILSRVSLGISRDVRL